MTLENLKKQYAMLVAEGNSFWIEPHNPSGKKPTAVMAHDMKLAAQMLKKHPEILNK